MFNEDLSERGNYENFIGIVEKSLFDFAVFNASCHWNRAPRFCAPKAHPVSNNKCDKRSDLMRVFFSKAPDRLIGFFSCYGGKHWYRNAWQKMTIFDCQLRISVSRDASPRFNKLFNSRQIVCCQVKSLEPILTPLPTRHRLLADYLKEWVQSCPS